MPLRRIGRTLRALPIRRSTPRCFIVLKRDLKATKTKSKRDDVRTERASERAGREQQLIRNKADEIMSRILYLDFVMPNGAPMRDCLGAEMASFGRGFQRIAEKVGAAQKVGDALTEQQVADLMGKAESKLRASAACKAAGANHEHLPETSGLSQAARREPQPRRTTT